MVNLTETGHLAGILGAFREVGAALFQNLWVR